jgi:hypothetical protein
MIGTRHNRDYNWQENRQWYHERLSRIQIELSYCRMHKGGWVGEGGYVVILRVWLSILRVMVSGWESGRLRIMRPSPTHPHPTPTHPPKIVFFLLLIILICMVSLFSILIMKQFYVCVMVRSFISINFIVKLCNVFKDGLHSILIIYLNRSLHILFIRNHFSV